MSSVTHVSSRARFTRPCLPDDVGVARNFYWDRPDNPSAEVAESEIETPKASRGKCPLQPTIGGLGSVVKAENDFWCICRA